LKKESPGTQSERKAFQEIKNVFSKQVSLTHPDFNKTFCVQTDASILGLGAELFQVDHNNARHTISFASRILIAAEKNFTISELELLGIVFTCQKFRIYILEYPIELYTDHQALIFLFTCKLRNARLSRWTLLLQEYNLKIRYCPGKENPVDTLSRHPVGRDDVNDNRQPVILSMMIPPTIPSSLIQILYKMSNEQKRDNKLLKIRDNLNGNNRLSKQLSKNYLLHNDILFIRKSDHSASP